MPLRDGLHKTYAWIETQYLNQKAGAQVAEETEQRALATSSLGHARLSERARLSSQPRRCGKVDSDTSCANDCG